jgi:hypothetical protein
VEEKGMHDDLYSRQTMIRLNEFDYLIFDGLQHSTVHRSAKLLGCSTAWCNETTPMHRHVPRGYGWQYVSLVLGKN